MKVELCSPTQHSITKSRVSLAHTTSLGNSSTGEKNISDDGLKGGEKIQTSDHLGNGSFWQRKVFIRWCSVARMTFSVGHVGIKRARWLSFGLLIQSPHVTVLFLNWPLCLPCVFFLYPTEDPSNRLYRSLPSTQSHFCRSSLENLSMFVWNGDWNTRVFSLVQMGIWISRFSFPSLFGKPLSRSHIAGQYWRISRWKI